MFFKEAFPRLARVIKKAYPRLPVLLLADGLYANQTVFGICQNNDWRFILTFKEGNLKSVWQEINLLRPLRSGQRHERVIAKTAKGWLTEQIQYINDLVYQKHKLHWVEIRSGYSREEPLKYFSHISDIPMDKQTCWQSAVRDACAGVLKMKASIHRRMEGITCDISFHGKSSGQRRTIMSYCKSHI